MSIYHKQCREVVGVFKRGLITKETALRQLVFIAERTYARYPNAEPDGDITYCIATAVEDLNKIASANKLMQPTQKPGG